MIIDSDGIIERTFLTLRRRIEISDGDLSGPSKTNLKSPVSETPFGLWYTLGDSGGTTCPGHIREVSRLGRIEGRTF